MKYIQGISVPTDAHRFITRHVKDPVRYPKVQCGYEKLSESIFYTQTANMLYDLTKKMITFKK